jgi:hypothetical protein
MLPLLLPVLLFRWVLLPICLLLLLLLVAVHWLRIVMCTITVHHLLLLPGLLLIHATAMLWLVMVVHISLLLKCLRVLLLLLLPVPGIHVLRVPTNCSWVLRLGKPSSIGGRRQCAGAGNISSSASISRLQQLSLQLLLRQHLLLLLLLLKQQLLMLQLLLLIFPGELFTDFKQLACVHMQLLWATAPVPAAQDPCHGLI